MTTKPVDPVHPRWLGHFRQARAVRPGRGAHAERRPPDARLPPRHADHLRPRCRPARGADGQFRGRAHEHRRGPGGADGSGADRPCHSDGHLRRRTCAGRFRAVGEGFRRDGACDRPGLAGRCSRASGPYRGGREGRGRPGSARSWFTPSRTGATWPPERRPLQVETALADALPAARTLPPYRGAISRWTATAGGTGWRRPGPSMVARRRGPCNRVPCRPSPRPRGGAGRRVHRALRRWTATTA